MYVVLGRCCQVGLRRTFPQRNAVERGRTLCPPQSCLTESLMARIRTDVVSNDGDFGRV